LPPLTIDGDDVAEAIKRLEAGCAAIDGRLRAAAGVAAKTAAE
jgi:hypothetical protein